MTNIPAGKDKVFHQLTVAGLKAFLQGMNGRMGEAVKILKKMTFLPVPVPQYNDKNELRIFFRHFFTGMAIAIESKDRQLLFQMLKVISIDDQTLYGEKNLFRLFWAFPNLKYFLDNVGAGMQTALSLFFGEFR